MTKFKAACHFSSAFGMERSERFFNGAVDSHAALSVTATEANTTLHFVIPSEANPDFLLCGPHQRPRVRLSVRKAA
jgi:hypothetical protein